MNIPSLRTKVALLTAATLATVSTALGAFASEPDTQQAARGCAAQFERAQRQDMESFRDYDAETFRRLHHRDALTVFAGGTVRYGIDEVMRALAPHFANREAIWTWTELYRVVDGCKSAFILYDATYDIPSIGYHHRTLTGVTYTRKGNRWLAVADQNTYLEAPGL